MVWLRLHTDIVGDAKLMRAARLGIKNLTLVPWLLAFAKAADDSGRLTVAGNPAEPVDLLMGIPDTRLTAADMTRLLDDLTGLGVLVKDRRGRYQFRNWNKRQFVTSVTGSPPSAQPEKVRARVARHRQKTMDDLLALALGDEAPNTACNDPKSLHRSLQPLKGSLQGQMDVGADTSGNTSSEKKLLDNQVGSNEGSNEGNDVSKNPIQSRDRTETEGDANASPARNVRAGWLKPYAAAWYERFGSNATPPFGQMAKALNKLDDQHGPEAVVPEWRAFIRTTDLTHLNLFKFASGYGSWVMHQPSANGRHASLNPDTPVEAITFLDEHTP